MKTKTLFLSLLGLFAGVAVLTAQPAAKPVSIRGFSYEVPASDLHVAVGRKMTPFALLPYEPGKGLRLAAGTTALQFYVPSEASAVKPAAGGQVATPEWQPVASVTLPESGGDFLLGFVPQPPNEQGTRWRVQIIENDTKNYPVGSMRIINFSPFPLAFDVGGESAALQPGERMVTHPKLDEKYRSYLRIAAQTNDQAWALFHQGVASVTPSRRTTFIVAYSASYLTAIEARDEIETPSARSPRMLVIPWSDQPVL